MTSPVPAPAAVIDLLGMLAYAELVAFDRLAADARLAPDLRRRAILCEMASVEIGNHRLLVDRLVERGADPESAMRPFVAALAAYHDQTEPADWLEALAKAYVGDGIADDFFREVAEFLGPEDRRLVLDVLHDTRHEDFAAAELREAISADPRIANRLSMWSRRLMGEGMSQAQRIAVERSALAEMIITGTGDVAGVAALLKRLTGSHTARMSAVGLNN